MDSGTERVDSLRDGSLQVRLWEVESGEAVAAFRLHGAGTALAVVLGNPVVLVAGDDTGAVYMLAVEPEVDREMCALKPMPEPNVGTYDPTAYIPVAGMPSATGLANMLRPPPGLFFDASSQLPPGLFDASSQPPPGLFDEVPLSNQPPPGLFDDVSNQPPSGLFEDVSNQPPPGLFDVSYQEPMMASINATLPQPPPGLFDDASAGPPPGLFDAASQPMAAMAPIDSELPQPPPG